MLRAALACLSLCLSSAASSATFIVDTSVDTVLDDCDAEAPGDCSLRGAITAANALAGADDIAFDLPGSDAGFQPATSHWRIATTAELPLVSDTLVIDGFTQPGASPSEHAPLSPIAHTLKIELRGPDMNNTNCLLATGGLTVRGLVINHCNQALYLFESGTHVVEGNYIGTDVLGETAIPNRFGVAMGGNLRVGGVLPAQANLISGNRHAALRQARQLMRLRVQGNVLGPNRQLDAIPALQDYGVQLTGPSADVLVGGPTPAEANTISGNGFNAIIISDNPRSTAGAPDVRVQGNLIGIGAAGTALGNGLNPGSPSQPLPSIQVGILGFCRVQIGGDGPGEGNLIAYGGQAAIAVNSCWNSPILGNAFLSNRAAAIDLATTNNFDGRTPNDAGDIDASGSNPLVEAAGNRLQNTAEVSAIVADADANELRVMLRVDSTPTASAYPLRLDFYRSDAFGILAVASTQSYGLADAQAEREFLLPLDGFGGGFGIVVTDANGNSSEMGMEGAVFADGFED